MLPIISNNVLHLIIRNFSLLSFGEEAEEDEEEVTSVSKVILQRNVKCVHKYVGLILMVILFSEGTKDEKQS